MVKALKKISFLAKLFPLLRTGRAKSLLALAVLLILSS